MYSRETLRKLGYVSVEEVQSLIERFRETAAEIKKHVADDRDKLDSAAIAGRRLDTETYSTLISAKMSVDLAINKIGDIGD